MRKHSFLLFFLLFVSFGLSINAFSFIALDLHEQRYSDIINKLTNQKLQISNTSVRELWISHPFPRNGGGLDISDRYYLLMQNTNLWIRGSADSALGNFCEFTNLINLSKKMGLKVAVLINPLSKEKDFNRQQWSSADFTTSSLYYGKFPNLDLNKTQTRAKLKKDFDLLNNISAIWVLDFHKNFSLQNEQINFISRNLKNFYIYQDTNLNPKIPNVNSKNILELSLHYFAPQASDMKSIKDFNPQKGFHILKTKTFSFSQLASVLFLLAHHDSVVIPYSVWKKQLYRNLILMLDQNRAFQTKVIDNHTLILDSPAQVLMIYTGKKAKRQTFTMQRSLTGNFNSLYGHAELSANHFQWSVFILPESVYLWQIQ